MLLRFFNFINYKLHFSSVTPHVTVTFKSQYVLVIDALSFSANEKCQMQIFYPRPVLAFGYCRCLRLSVCVSVCVCGNHMLVRAITHHPFELGSPNLDHRCKRLWLRSLLFWGGDWPWPSRSNLTSKSKFTPFWVCLCDNSSPLQARITKFEPELQNTLVKIPVVLGVDWAWLVKFNYFQKSCLFASLLRLWNICETCKNV